jgi:hypothetical protein
VYKFKFNHVGGKGRNNSDFSVFSLALFGLPDIINLAFKRSKTRKEENGPKTGKD